MYKKILITGGAGYIGSHLVHKLLSDFKNKVKIIVVDNFVNSYEQDIDGVLLEKVDINKLGELDKVFAKYKFNYVFHFAALADARESQNLAFEYFQTNVGGTINVLHCIAKNKIKNFLFASSCSVYGNLDGLITEDITPMPISVYGQTKLISEDIIKQFCKEYKINATIFRLFNVAGAGKNGLLGERSRKNTRIITNVCMAVLNSQPIKIYGNTYSTKDGTCGRDYVHVEDVTEACVAVLKNHKMYKNYSEVFNVGSCNLVTNLEIVKEVEEVSGVTVNISFGERNKADPQSVVSSIDKMHKLHRWKPRKSSISNIVKTSWYWFSNLK